MPEAFGESSFLVHPFALPEDFRTKFRRVEAWLKHRGVEIRDARIQAQTYFACKVVRQAVKHIKYDYFYRDYFLESIDHLTEVSRLSILHPDPSFGPGQRYLSKGSYVLELGEAARTLDPQWIVPE